MKKYNLLVLFMMAVFLVAASPRNEELKRLHGVDFDKLLDEIDQIGNFEDSDFASDVSMAAVDSKGKTTFTKARVYRRDKEEKYVLIITEPESQKGKGYLQINDSLWIYDPSSRKFEHTTMKETIEGSDAKYSDFNMGTLSDDYAIKDVASDKLGGHECWVLELHATATDVAYPIMRIWVRKDLPIVLRSNEYGLSIDTTTNKPRLLRISLFQSYMKIGDKYMPSKILQVDNLNQGERTQVTIENPTTAKQDDFIFTKVYLERVSN